MKRPLAGEDAKMGKKVKHDQEPEKEDGGGAVRPTGFASLPKDLLFEVLKHADARTLAVAACVSKLWHRTAQDDRLWEPICTQRWPSVGCLNQWLRSVVLALGGFSRLHLLFHTVFTRQPGSASSSSASVRAPALVFAPAWAGLIPRPLMLRAIQPRPMLRADPRSVDLFLSLLSIRCRGKMNFTGRGR